MKDACEQHIHTVIVGRVSQYAISIIYYILLLKLFYKSWNLKAGEYFLALIIVQL
jgi:hypothetical protein